MIAALRSLVEELENDRLLDQPDHLCRRVDALDRLEAYMLEPPPSGSKVYQRVRALSAQMEAANVALYQAIRGEIQQGAGPERLLRFAGEAGLAQGDGYDCLDELVLGVLQFEDPRAEPVPLAAEMVFYQPTPARHIFDLIARTALTENDVLIDLGSGLGQVSLLVSICTRARSIGIELEPAYIDCARHCARELNLSNVTFLRQDARTADLSAGTVFYLYTPFTGTILRAVLDSLRQEASTRQIRICTFGPCTPIIAQEPWLEAKGPLATDQIALFCPRK